jgi:hypothetical protein
MLNEAQEDIPLKLSPIKYNELFKAKTRFARENDIELFTCEQEIEDIQMIMTLSYRKQSGKATFLLNDNKNSVLRLRDIRNGSMAICGFCVPINLINILCFDIDRVGHFIANTNKPEGFKFDFSRSKLLSSEMKQKFESEIIRFIHSGYREFLQKSNSYNTEDIYNLNTQSRMHGGGTFDNYTEYRLSKIFEEFPDLFCLKLFQINGSNCINNVKVSFFNLNDILNFTDVIWTCQTSIYVNYIHDEALINIAFGCLSLLNIRNGYLLEPCVEGSMLFDNDVNAEVHIIPMQFNHKLMIVKLMKINPKSIYLHTKHNWIIANVRGRWSGYVYERKIISPDNKFKFTFMGRYRLIVDIGSLIADDIKNLYSKGKTLKLANLIELLRQAEEGHVDDSIRKYLV